MKRALPVSILNLLCIPGVSVMRSRMSFRPAISTNKTCSDLRPDLFPPSIGEVVADIVPVPPMPIARQIALVTLLRNNLSVAVLPTLLKMGKAEAADYRALEDDRLAQRGPDRWHMLTPFGRYKAMEIAKRIAKDHALHIVGEINFNTGTRNATLSCSCGWHTQSLKGNFTRSNLERASSRHLAEVEAGRYPPAPSIAPAIETAMEKVDG